MTTEIAQNMLELALSELNTRNKDAVISVCDESGNLFGLIRTQNAPLTSITISMNKAYTAALEKKPSFEIGEMLRDKSLGYDIAYFGDARITGFGGGVPIFINENLIGALGISGLPEKEDMEIADLVVQKIKKSL